MPGGLAKAARLMTFGGPSDGLAASQALQFTFESGLETEHLQFQVDFFTALLFPNGESMGLSSLFLEPNKQFVLLAAGAPKEGPE